MSQPIKITIDGKEKIIGKIKDNLAIFPRQRSKHFFRKYKGWAISESVVNRLIENGIDFIGIKDTENNEKHLIAAKKFKKESERLSEEETGDDRQLVTPEKKFINR